MAGIGIYPNYLFSILWLSPLFIIVSLQILWGKSNIFSELAKGDCRLVISSAMAALFCGFFWELWNYYSFAKWIYSVPFVHKFQVFEMPILGYAGYLPFGLECAVVGEIISQVFPENYGLSFKGNHK